MLSATPAISCRRSFWICPAVSAFASAPRAAPPRIWPPIICPAASATMPAVFSSVRSRAATTSSTRSSARRPAPALAGFRSILPSCLTSFRTKNSSSPSRMFRSKRTRTASNTLPPRCRSTFSTSCTNISASTRPTKLCAPRSRRTTRSATSLRRSANSASSISPRSPARSSTSSISSRWSVQSI